MVYNIETMNTVVHKTNKVIWNEITIKCKIKMLNHKEVGTNILVNSILFKCFIVGFLISFILLKQGTLIRVFDVSTKKKIAEFRRGADPAVVYWSVEWVTR